MATSAIRTLSVAPEIGVGGFANIDSLTGAPSTAGLTYVSLECERAALLPFGEPILQEREDARAGPHMYSPEYETGVVSGSRATRLQGTIEVSCVVRTLGDLTGAGVGDFTTYSGATGIPWVNLLATMFAEDTAGGISNLADDVTAAVGLNIFTPTLDTNFGIGQMFAVNIDDRIEWSAVTDIGVGPPPVDITHSPAMSRGLTAGPPIDSVRLARTYYAPDDLLTARGVSVALSMDGDGWGYNAFGCRAEAVKFELRGRMLMATFTLRCAQIEPKLVPVATDFRAALGSVAHLVDSYVVYSGAAPVDGNAAPVSLGRTTLPVSAFEATFTQPLVARGTPENIVGVAEWEVGGDPTYEMSMTVSTPDTVIETDLRDMVARNILVGFGPHGPAAGITPSGDGAALFFPAARMTTSPVLRNLGNGLVEQDLVFGNGRWYGDATAGLAPAHSSVRIGLSR